MLAVVGVDSPFTDIRGPGSRLPFKVQPPLLPRFSVVRERIELQCGPNVVVFDDISFSFSFFYEFR